MSAHGPGWRKLTPSIIAALRKCQPYNMPPPNKYDEWRVFDISFTPPNLLGRAKRAAAQRTADRSGDWCSDPTDRRFTTSSQHASEDSFAAF